MNAISGVTFEKDASGNNRYIRIDLHKHAQLLHPFMLKLGIIKEYPEGWENALSSEDFLMEAREMLKKKFDDRNKI
jgi:hypothetical protein